MNQTLKNLIIIIFAAFILGIFGTNLYSKTLTSRVVNKTSPAPSLIITPTATPMATLTPTITPRPIKTSWVGKISGYSENGCLGCSKTLTMANGERLDDDRATIAFNYLPMNTRVLVKNLDNGKSIEALVTDTGGFERYGRIADLTPVVTNAIEAKTDTSNIQISKL